MKIWLKFALNLPWKKQAQSDLRFSGGFQTKSKKMIWKRIHISCITLLLLFFVIQQSSAQQRRFKAGPVFGFNAAQILGDDIGGYNKLGIQGGLRAIAVLQDRMDLSFEILYSQRGSYCKCPLGDIRINLQYIEVPFVFSFKDWLHEEEGYYRVQASAGVSYGRLLDANASGSMHDDLTENFNTNDFGFTGGVDYFANQHLGFGVRWSKSFNLLYNKDKHDPGRNSLRGFFLSFRAAYIF